MPMVFASLVMAAIIAAGIGSFVELNRQEAERRRSGPAPGNGQRGQEGRVTNLHLDPYLIHFGSGFGIRWYGFFLAVSMALGVHFLGRRGARAGVDEDTVFNRAMLAILGGVVGARLVYVLTNWGYFAANPGQIIQVQQGGLSIRGALIGGMSAAMWYAARRRLRFWVLMDGMVPGVCVGRSPRFHIPGRLW